MRLLLVDDHEMVRSAFARLLNAQSDMEVVGEAASFEEGLSMWRDLHPDILTLDLDLPDQTGCDAALRLLKEQDAPKVVICSYRAHPAEVEMLVQGGVSGYITKASPGDELVLALRTVGGGKSYFCARSLNALKEARTQYQEGNITAPTPRQLEILALVAAGQNTKEIAATLGLSPKTVENYRSAIMRRLDAKNLAHAVTLARSLKLLPD